MVAMSAMVEMVILPVASGSDESSRVSRSGGFAGQLGLCGVLGDGYRFSVSPNYSAGDIILARNLKLKWGKL